MPANFSHIHLIRLFLAFALGLLLTTGPAMALDASSIDLPPCDASAPGKTSGLSLGIVQPGAAPTVLEYAARLTLQAPQGISICSESWGDVLPRWAPWAKALERGYGFALFLLALVTVVGLLYWKTPKHWWQRTTLVSVLSIGGLGWLLGTWLGNRPLFVAGGVLLGVSLALFMLFRKLESLGREPETPREDPS